MEPALAAKFPELKTYSARGLDDPTASARFDVTPDGFHGIVRSGRETIYIDPYRRADASHYLSYFKRDFGGVQPKSFQCDFALLNPGTAAPGLRTVIGALTSGNELREYRIAVATTGEYTQFHGGTVNDGMAAVVTTLNRVNFIYERELGVRLLLVANNDLIVYTNAVTDPYTNNSGFAMLTENQTTLDAVIGDGSYDIGHVLSTGGGGLGWLRSTCDTQGNKAKGVTGLANPVGDPFYVDYVAHEIGHQFGANHTFNGFAGSCSGQQRNPGTAYEPGSGSTIMAYAGICLNHNLQPNSDAYFHGASFDEIVSFVTQGAGNDCPVVTSTLNSAPVVDAGSNYTIPLETPFTLTGSASDSDGDALTYAWEEFDLGPSGDPFLPVGDAPIFRTLMPTVSPSRTFPKLSDLVNNTSTIGELLPSYGRVLTFRLTARDNRGGGGGVASDSMTVDVADNAGPFVVTSPNTQAVTWASNTPASVTWDVANTDAPPVSCANVDIWLSTDGGFSFPTALAAQVPNIGSASVTAPNIPTAEARVKVQCAGNIFFDISDEDFVITGASTDLIFSDGFEF
jgi:hypothetical protein